MPRPVSPTIVKCLSQARRARRDWLFVASPSFSNPPVAAADRAAVADQLQGVFNAACYAFGVGPRGFTGRGRYVNGVESSTAKRWAAFWVAAHRVDGASISAIARTFHRHHSTVLHALRNINPSQPEFADAIDAIEAAIEAGHVTRASFDLSTPDWLTKKIVLPGPKAAKDLVVR